MDYQVVLSPSARAKRPRHRPLHLILADPDLNP
jgi:hypothetical protein